VASRYKPASQGGEVKEQQGRSNPLEGRTKTFFCEVGQRRVIVPLDDDLIPVRRHRMWLPNPPTKAIYGYRLTCACWDPREYDGLEPRLCRACNGVAMGYTDPGITPPATIWHATVIAEGELLRKDKQSGQTVGTGIFDYRYLLELDDKGKQMWDVKKNTYGGTLKGMRINVFRSMPPRGQKAKTPRYGESWDVLPGGPVDLRLHFWNSPAIPRLMEYSQRSGSGAIDHQTAVQNLIAPINYEEEFDNYTEEAADRMIAIAAGKPVDMGVPAAGPGGAYAPPPMPGGMPWPGYQPQGGQYPPPAQGQYPPQAMPVDYSTATMPAGQVPTYAPQPAPQFSAPGAPYVPPQSQQGYQPPPVPDPIAAPQTQAAPPAYQPPPPPVYQPPTQTSAPPAMPQYQPPPTPTPMGPPSQPAPPTFAPAAPAYNFDQGWSPGFPPPQGQPQGQPQQASLQAAPVPQPTPPPPPPQQPAAPVPHYDKPPF